MRKDYKQLEFKVKEFQTIIKGGGNLLEWMRKSTEKTEKVDAKDTKEVKDEKEEAEWKPDELAKLKEGLKEHAGVKDAKEKFKLIAKMVGSKS